MAALPDDCRLELTLEGASWRPEEPGEAGEVTLYLDRRDGDWAPALTADATHQSVATHDGYIVSSPPGADGEALLVRLRFRRDKWNDIVSEGAYRMRFTVADEGCTGTWEGVLHGRKGRGRLTGTVAVTAQY